MSFSQELEEQRIEILQARLYEQQVELGRVRKELRETLNRLQRAERVLDSAGRGLQPPRWLTRPARNESKHATVVTILSDCHFDEVVDPSELNGRNAYNRDIALIRLERFFQQIIRLSRDYLAGMIYDGVVLCLGGDLISGEIHEELKETNETGTLDTVLFWSEQIAAGCALLADVFEKLHVVSVSGNHGRRTKQVRMKGRGRDNYDWLIAQLLARHFKADKRITFDIPDSPDCFFRVYDTGFLLTHGDQVKGGGGIGGIWPPIMRMVAKKRTRFSFESILMGHWHQLILAPSAGLIVNGSLKGEDEFAAIMGFAPEPPQQALFTVSPTRGVTFSAPILVQDRKREGW
jgi:uncharacterized coiled-coil protein SlyX